MMEKKAKILNQPLKEAEKLSVPEFRQKKCIKAFFSEPEIINCCLYLIWLNFIKLPLPFVTLY